MIFNSAIQRVTAKKDREIESLREQLMAQSQMIPSTSMSQSMTASTSQLMTKSLMQPPASSSSPPSIATDQQAANIPAQSLSESVENARDKDKLTISK